MVTALALQGLLSLLWYWSSHWPFPFTMLRLVANPYMWAIRIFLAYELILFAQTLFTGKHTKLPWIGEYADKAL